jgi:predicted nucleotidyltransferase
MQNVKRLIYSSVVLTILILFSSCARQQFITHSDIDRTVDFSQYQTFTMAEIELPQHAEDDIMNNALVQKRIKDNVAAELKARGYQEVESGGDLFVRAFKRTQERREEETRYHPAGMGMGYWGGFWGGPWGWGSPFMWGRPWGWGMGSIPYTHVREFIEGQVIVNVYDQNKNELVWQGWSRGEVRPYRRTMRNREQAIVEKVSEIMADFPYAVPTQPEQLPTAQQPQ